MKTQNMKTQNIIQPIRHHLQPLALAVTMGLGLATSAPALITIEMVTVGDAGNTADTTGAPNPCGAVASAFRIGKYEVTNQQYCDFLNAADPTGANSYGLYNSNMGSQARGGISFTAGNANGTKYAVRTGTGYTMANKPVNFMDFWDAVRFANWLHNGQPNDGSGLQDGAYTLTGTGQYPTNWATITRKTGATWFLPSENEWYKAAYYKGGGTSAGYWDYPTQSDTLPTAVTANSAGDGSAGSSGNYANCNNAADWNGQDGNVTTVGSNGGPGAYGTYDMGGNVWEFNEAIMPPSGGQGYRSGGFNSTDAGSGYNMKASFRGYAWPAGSASDGYLHYEVIEGGFRMAAAAASSPTYDTWAAAQVPPVTGGPSGDSNNDGVANGVAYFMKDAGLLTNPGIVGGSVTWTNGGNIPSDQYGTQFVVQTSSDLQNWIVPTTGVVNQAGSVSYTLPTGEAKIFVRLKVTPN
jgi:sulfatase modifying factor 1